MDAYSLEIEQPFAQMMKGVARELEKFGSLTEHLLFPMPSLPELNLATADSASSTVFPQLTHEYPGHTLCRT